MPTLPANFLSLSKDDFCMYIIVICEQNYIQQVCLFFSNVSHPHQVKEMGLLGMNCECLAGDAQKLFDVYWYLSSPGAHIPNPWPSQFTADTSLSHPATVSINGTPAVAFWAVSLSPAVRQAIFST